MNPSDLTIAPAPELSYLLPHVESFWRWSRDAQAVEWRDGNTIAFRAEINAILTRLAPHHVPPFGALVLLLAATRESWESPDALATRILAGYAEIETGMHASAPLLSSVVSHRVRQDVAGVVDDLSAVAALPAELRQTLRGRCALAEFVFAPAKPSMNDRAAARLLSMLQEGFAVELLRDPSGHDSDYSRLTAEMDALRPGLPRVAVEPVTKWARTGLDRFIEAAQGIDIAPAERVRTLLRDLQSDPQLAGIAKLARDVLAALHVPRALAAPEEIPVGGVSDISNRGPLDRLLVSELAHDDLTLAIRVALNEALYLRRESPARQPPVSRAILIDVGIRMWGVPRLFAASVALALAAAADRRGAVYGFRSRGNDVSPIHLTTVDGVNGLLEAIEPEPHPAGCIASFIAHADDSSADVEQEVEGFIVTHQAALNDPDFMNGLWRGEAARRDWFVATVAIDGSFALWRIGRGGRQELTRAQLSLAEIAPPQTTVKGASSELLKRYPDLPTILLVQPLPLCLSATLAPRNALYSEAFGLIGVTHDRRLMQWRREHGGGIQLHPALPSGRVEALFLDEQRGAAYVVILRGKQNKLDLLAFDLTTTQFEHREFNRNQPRRVFIHNGVIGLGYGHEVRWIDPRNWVERVVKLNPGMRWCGVGRFLEQFLRTSSIYAATADGIHLVTSSASGQPFQREGSGPWLLQRDGTVTNADEGGAIVPDRPWDPPATVKLVATSHDGNRLIAHVAAGGAASGEYLLNLLSPQKPAWRQTFGDQAAIVGPAVSRASGIPLRHNFDGIFVDDTGMLALTKGKLSISIYRNPAGELALRTTQAPRDRHRQFSRTTGIEGHRYKLKVATWPNGHRAFLDSRGMLHLVSAGMPQLTFTLSDQSLAGWTSDGRTFGWAYFVHEKATEDASMVEALIREFARRLA